MPSKLNLVLLKGTALAYSLYDNPAHRFRGDSDLLVRESDLAAARQILVYRGWQRPFGAPGPFGAMHYQELWQYRDPAGLSHDIDLHWEVTNSIALRNVLDVDDVLARSLALPRLSANARCADAVTALIHRAVNRAVHAQSGYFSIDRYEYGPDRLSWAVDIDLLAHELTQREWGMLISRSCATGVAATVSGALEFADNRLGTQVPEHALSQLSRAPTDTSATRFLSARSEFQRNLANLKATPGLLPRLRYTLSRAFPSRVHMSDKYPRMSQWPIAFLYLRRILEKVLCTRARTKA